jgi:hypothetical protein
MSGKSQLTRAQSLAAIPVFNEGVTLREQADGTVHLTVRIRRKPGFFARFQPPVMERNVKLDELGSFVVRLVDGNRSTRDVVDAFAATYKVTAREAELSCVQFFKLLAARHAISIVVK